MDLPMSAECGQELPGTVRRFIDAINRHDATALGDAMTTGHELVDGPGEVLRGREPVLKAWRRYFEWFPDYRIEVRSSFSAYFRVALFG